MNTVSISIVTESRKSCLTTTAQLTSNKNPYFSLIETPKSSTKDVVSSDRIKLTNNKRVSKSV